MNRIGAFFDIDGTLYREGLITSIFKKMIKSEIIDSKLWYLEVEDKYNKWDKRIGNYDDYLLKMASIYTDAIRGLHKTQIEFIAKKVVEQKGDRVYIYTRDRLIWHREQGHKIVIISGSPQELVRAMASKYKVDTYLGSEYILDKNDLYTGQVVPMWDSKSKKKALTDLVIKYNIDLDSSYAYGDTTGDYAMLKAVGKPVAMNPTKELVNKIMANKEFREKIDIVVERKDMIYKLEPNMLKID